MNWSSRRVLIAVSCAAAGVIGAGALTAVAYASSPNRGADALYGCVNVRSGALRVVNPEGGRPCATRGLFREYAVTLNQAAGLPGPTGPRGPRGPAGDGIDSIDALQGLPCNVGTEDEGEFVITFGPPEQGSWVRMICQTDSTVLTPPPPLPPETPEPIPTTVHPTIGEGNPDPTTAPPPQPTTEPPPPSSTSAEPPPPAA